MADGRKVEGHDHIYCVCTKCSELAWREIWYRVAYGAFLSSPLELETGSPDHVLELKMPRKRTFAMDLKTFFCSSSSCCGLSPYAQIQHTSSSYRPDACPSLSQTSKSYGVLQGETHD